MTIATETSSVKNPLIALANNVAKQLAAEQLRYAQYFTPYGFDPEREDFERVASLILRPVSECFPGASEAFVSRITSVARNYQTLKENLDALKAAGAEPDLSGDELYQAARNAVVNTYATPMRAVG